MTIHEIDTREVDMAAVGSVVVSLKCEWAEARAQVLACREELRRSGEPSDDWSAAELAIDMGRWSLRHG